MAKAWRRTKGFWRRAAMIAAGCMAFALSFNLFLDPFHIAPGGVIGVAMVANALSGFPVGVAMVVINLPLVVVAWLRLGKRFIAGTAAATALASAMIDLSAPFLKPPLEDPMLACLCGGVLLGVGLGMIMRAGATTGGSDIAGRLIQIKRPHVHMGQAILLVDGCVVCVSAAVFGGFDLAVYAIITLFVSGRVMDMILYGLDFATLTYVISKRAEEIGGDIMKELGRGVTYLDASGGYTGERKRVILCAVGRREISALRSVIARHDPAAFLIVTDGHQIYGDGFLRW